MKNFVAHSVSEQAQQRMLIGGFADAAWIGAEHMPRVDAALRRTYGWKLRVTELVTGLRRSRVTRVGIVVRDA